MKTSQTFGVFPPSALSLASIGADKGPFQRKRPAVHLNEDVSFPGQTFVLRRPNESRSTATCARPAGDEASQCQLSSPGRHEQTQSARKYAGLSVKRMKSVVCPGHVVSEGKNFHIKPVTGINKILKKNWKNRLKCLPSLIAPFFIRERFVLKPCWKCWKQVTFNTVMLLVFFRIPWKLDWADWNDAGSDLQNRGLLFVLIPSCQNPDENFGDRYVEFVWATHCLSICCIISVASAAHADLWPPEQSHSLCLCPVINVLLTRRRTSRLVVRHQHCNCVNVFVCPDRRRCRSHVSILTTAPTDFGYFSWYWCYQLIVPFEIKDQLKKNTHRNICTKISRLSL